MRNVEAEAITEAELEADGDVKTFIMDICAKAKEIKKKYVRFQAMMDVLRKQKEKEGAPSELKILLEEMRGRNCSSPGNNTFFKRAELKHRSFKPGETNYKEWFEVFEMSAQNLPEAPKLLLLHQSLERTAKECIRSITPGNGGYKLAVANLRTTYGDDIKNASEEMSQLIEWAIQPAGRDLMPWSRGAVPLMPLIGREFYFRDLR